MVVWWVVSVGRVGVRVGGGGEVGWVGVMMSVMVAELDGTATTEGSMALPASIGRVAGEKRLPTAVSAVQCGWSMTL